MMTPYDLKAAHKHSSCHADELANSNLCGCFYCLRVYKPDKITQWINEDSAGKTAVCAYCLVDSVIGSASGYPLTDDFLRQMHHYWFKQ